MENTLVQLIAECVTKNVVFTGLVSSNYTVQDLVHTTTLTSLNKMYKRTKKELDGLETDTLFDSSNSTRKNRLELEVNTIKAVFEYNKALADAEKEKAKRLEKRKALLALKSKKEIEVFEGKSIEEIDKALAELV